MVLQGYLRLCLQIWVKHARIMELWMIVIYCGCMAQVLYNIYCSSSVCYTSVLNHLGLQIGRLSVMLSEDNVRAILSFVFVHYIYALRQYGWKSQPLSNSFLRIVFSLKHCWAFIKYPVSRRSHLSVFVFLDYVGWVATYFAFLLFILSLIIVRNFMYVVGCGGESIRGMLSIVFVDLIYAITILWLKPIATITTDCYV